jgi:hypothetical protein
MILTIDGKIHHLKELDFIERQLSGLLDPNDYYRALANFLKDSVDLKTKKYLTVEEVEKVDRFTYGFFKAKLQEWDSLFLRAFVIGRLLSDSDVSAKIFSIGEFNKLPDTIREVVKVFDLTMQEAKALEQALAMSEVSLTNSTVGTMQQVRNALYSSIVQGEGAEGIERRLREMVTGDIGELNRDWQRVAISTANAAFNNGYLSQMKEGEFVVGISMPDCCPHCDETINGKVYRVTKTPPSDYSNLSDAEYEKASKMWENYIWEGKSNVGRSFSPKKRIDKEIGNKADNLEERLHHELSMPACPAHPNCRCRWMAFYPEWQWIDEKGNIRLSIEDPEKHKEFYEKLMAGV